MATSTCPEDPRASGDPHADGDPSTPAVNRSWGLAQWRPPHWHPANPLSSLPKPHARTAAEQLRAGPPAPPASGQRPPSPFEVAGPGPATAGSPAMPAGSQPLIPTRCRAACPSQSSHTSLPAAFTRLGKHLPLLSSPRAQGVERRWSHRVFFPWFAIPRLEAAQAGSWGPLGSERNPSSNSPNLRTGSGLLGGGGTFTKLCSAAELAACPPAQTPGPARGG